jgi:hypothetical protein
MPKLKKTKGSTDLTSAVMQAVDRLIRLGQTRRLLCLSFLQGFVSAFGAMVAVVIVIPLVLWTLQAVSWPPIINGVISMIIYQMEQVNRQSPQGVDGQ